VLRLKQGYIFSITWFGSIVCTVDPAGAAHPSHAFVPAGLLSTNKSEVSDGADEPEKRN